MEIQIRTNIASTARRQITPSPALSQLGFPILHLLVVWLLRAIHLRVGSSPESDGKLKPERVNFKRAYQHLYRSSTKIKKYCTTPAIGSPRSNDLSVGASLQAASIADKTASKTKTIFIWSEKRIDNMVQLTESRSKNEDKHSPYHVARSLDFPERRFLC